MLVFHHLPSLAGPLGLHDAVDVATPFFVVGAALATLLALGAGWDALLVGFLAAIAYVDGHGIHLSANAIRERPLSGKAADVAHFWDERFGHIWWHLGWFGLVAAVCLADRGRATRLDPRLSFLVAAMLGVTLFTNTVEGGTWPLELAAAVGFAAWAAASRRPFVVAAASAFGVGAALIGIWAAWHGGVPQFSQVGWI